jgi:anthranilate synthase component 1
MSSDPDFGDAALIISEACAGGTIHRCERLISGTVDPATAAAALRADRGRALLNTAGRDARGDGVLAVGELAVISSAPDSERGRGPESSVLRSAVSFIDALEFPGAAFPEERRWFGMVGYDAARDFERLKPRSDGDLPTYDLFIPAVLVRFEAGAVRVIGRGTDPESAAAACAEAVQRLAAPPPPAGEPAEVGVGRFTLTKAGYRDTVARAKRHIVDGDIFQVVLSLGLSVPTTVDGLTLYSRLVAANPSPYQFWYSGGVFEAAGCSPEPCVGLENGRATIRALAGTRPRGADPDADARAEADLRSCEKELAEHRMLVDLARNDLGRVCVPGSVTVPELMSVDRTSDVMHLTSDVIGELGAGRDAADLIAATFPAGTMTGAPKVRAMEIIDELEPVGRAFYSGAVGSFGPDDVDLWLTIRSVVLFRGLAFLRAGGGIVFDSDPDHEYAECIAKFGAPARAVGLDLAEVPA